MSSRQLLRVFAIAAAVLAASAAVEAWSISQRTGSLGARVAAVAAALGAVVAVGAVLWPDELVRLLTRWPAAVVLAGRLQAMDALSRPAARSHLMLATVMVIWGFVCFAANVFGHALAPPPVAADDQGAYLATAERAHSPYGPMVTLATLFGDLRSGAFKEDNRHPLFIGLLAVRPTETWGRILAWLFSAVGMTSAVALVWRRFSPLAAGLFAILLGLNADFGLYSVMVVCESALITWIGLTYFALLPPVDAAQSTARRRLRIVLASGLLGLAFLTKGTGLVFFLVFLGWLAWQCLPQKEQDTTEEDPVRTVLSLDEPDPLRQWVLAMLLGVIGFVVVAGPLLERNIRVFGNPFHNINSLLLFADDYSEFERMLRLKIEPGEAAREYFSTHSAGQMLVRELRGLVWEAFIMLRTLGPKGLDDGRIVFGIPLAMAAGLSLWFDRRPAKFLLMAWIVACWVMFAWYVPIAAGDRFPIPLLFRSWRMRRMGSRDCSRHGSGDAVIERQDRVREGLSPPRRRGRGESDQENVPGLRAHRHSVLNQNQTRRHGERGIVFQRR